MTKDKLPLPGDLIFNQDAWVGVITSHELSKKRITVLWLLLNYNNQSAHDEYTYSTFIELFSFDEKAWVYAWH
jgi:hypothetical protein